MRPDLMLVTTQGVRGGKTHTNRQGNCRITISKGHSEPSNSIWVDVPKGAGETYKPSETALINITFSDGTQWNGTFDNLKKSLKL